MSHRSWAENNTGIWQNQLINWSAVTARVFKLEGMNTPGSLKTHGKEAREEKKKKTNPYVYSDLTMFKNNISFHVSASCQYNLVCELTVIHRPDPQLIYIANFK